MLYVATDSWNLGQYLGMARYEGNDRYNASSCNVTVDLDPKVSYSNMVSRPDMIMSVGEKESMEFIAPASTAGKVEIIIANSSDDVIASANVSVSNGRGSFSMPVLAEGNYKIIIRGQIANHNFTRNIALTVHNNTGEVSVSVSPSEIFVGDNVNVVISSPLQTAAVISIDNVATVAVILSNLEKIIKPFSGLSVGTHKIKVFAAEGNVFYSNTFTVTVKEKPAPAPTPKVVKKATKITAKKKTFKVKTKVKKYAITLKSGKTAVKKVQLTLKVKGKTYKAKTNNKGKATFKIKNLNKKGKYTAVIKFKGNNNYKASSKKVKLTVKK